MKPKRIHPIVIFPMIARLFPILILPILRAIITKLSGSSPFSPDAGVWADVIILLLIGSFAIISYRSMKFNFTDEAIYFRHGVFVKSKTSIPVENAASVTIASPLYLRPLDAAIVSVETLAGNRRKVDLQLYLFRKDAFLLMECVQNCVRERSFVPLNKDKISIPNAKQPESSADIRDNRNIITAGITETVLISLIYSNIITGAIVIISFILQWNGFLADNLQEIAVDFVIEFSERLPFNLPPILAIIFGIIFLSWIVSFINNIIKYSRFSSARLGDSIFITGGFPTYFEHLLKFPHISYIDVRQTLLCRILGVYVVFVNCTGYGKQNKNFPILIPVSSRKKLRRNLSRIIAGYVPVPPDIRPIPSVVMRYLLLRFGLCSVVLLSGCIFSLIFPDWAELICFVIFWIAIPLILRFILSVIDSGTAGIAANCDTVTLSYTRGFCLHNVVIPRGKITGFTIRQSKASRKEGHCNLEILTKDESRTSHHIRGIREAEILRIMFNR